MDLYARKIIAWTLTDTMEVSCVVDTIRQAKFRRSTTDPLVIYSDRSSQYVSEAYRKVAEGMTRSYSHKGYPYDNACIESFHTLVRREWLNRFRIHSHCNYMSPDDYERMYKEVVNQNVKLAD